MLKITMSLQGHWKTNQKRRQESECLDFQCVFSPKLPKIHGTATRPKWDPAPAGLLSLQLLVLPQMR